MCDASHYLQAMTSRASAERPFCEEMLSATRERPLLQNLNVIAALPVVHWN
jgi:hypothetical protein